MYNKRYMYMFLENISWINWICHNYKLVSKKSLLTRQQLSSWEEELSTLTESSRVRYISVMALVMDLSFILPLLDFISSSSSAGRTRWKTLSSSSRAFPEFRGRESINDSLSDRSHVESRLPLTLFMVVLILFVWLCVLNSGKHHRCIITYLKSHESHV